MQLLKTIFRFKEADLDVLKDECAALKACLVQDASESPSSSTGAATSSVSPVNPTSSDVAAESALSSAESISPDAGQNKRKKKPRHHRNRGNNEKRARRHSEYAERKTTEKKEAAAAAATEPKSHSVFREDDKAHVSFSAALACLVFSNILLSGQIRQKAAQEAVDVPTGLTCEDIPHKSTGYLPKKPQGGPSEPGPSNETGQILFGDLELDHVNQKVIELLAQGYTYISSVPGG